MGEIEATYEKIKDVMFTVPVSLSFYGEEKETSHAWF